MGNRTVKAFVVVTVSNIHERVCRFISQLGSTRHYIPLFSSHVRKMFVIGTTKCCCVIVLSAMATQCQHDGCNCAVQVKEFRGPTDPADGDAVEIYECAQNHTFTVVLKAR